MELEILIPVAVISYLIGAISFSRVVTRLVKPDADLEHVTLQTEDGEPGAELRTMGATTASMKVGSRWGCLIGWLDILKVALPTLAVKLLFPDQPYFLVAAIFGMIGHNWPIYYRFKGGLGMSAIYGGALVVDFFGAILCAVVGLFLGLVVVKDVMVAYLAGPWLLIPWFWFRTRDPIYVAYAVIVNVIFILALLPEIRQQIKVRREGTYEMNATMESFPMGRGMLRIMERLGLSK